MRKVVYGDMEISASHAFVVSRPTGNVALKLKKNGVPLATGNFSYMTVSNAHKLADPALAESWLNSFSAQISTGDLVELEYDFGQPTIEVTGGAPNDTVTVSNTAHDEHGVAIATASTAYVVHDPNGGGCCEIMQ